MGTSDENLVRSCEFCGRRPAARERGEPGGRRPAWAADGTQLSLAHSGLGGKLVKDMHEEGWNALLTSLYGLFSA